MKKGRIETNLGIQNVFYNFVGDNTIKCIGENGKKFYTHYKSLIV